MRVYLSVAIRFALLSAQNSNAFLLGRQQPYADFKAAILDSAALSRRLQLFTTIALPGLQQLASDIQQSGLPITFRVHLVTSSELPTTILQELEKLVLLHPFLQLHLQSEAEANIRRPLLQIFQRIKTKALFITARMDDDDAIAADFFQILRPYLSERYAGHALSFANGYQMVLDHQLKPMGFLPHYEPKIAIFLCYLVLVEADQPVPYKTVYCLMNHRWVDQKVPLLVDARQPAFIRTVHPFSDTFSDVSRYQDVCRRIDPQLDDKRICQQFLLGAGAEAED